MLSGINHPYIYGQILGELEQRISVINTQHAVIAHLPSNNGSNITIKVSIQNAMDNVLSFCHEL